MPELPEVETTVRGIRKYAVGKTIVSCWTDYASAFHAGKDNIKDGVYFRKVEKIVKDAKITSVERRAKNILIHLSVGHTLLIHLKMTGHILYGKYNFDGKTWTAAKDGPLRDPFNRFIHFVITLNNGNHLALSDMRKFAKVTMVKTSLLDASLHTAHLGPEPLTKKFDLSLFKERLSKRAKMPIKSALMDQELISGIGNIYSDEILWRAGVHPESKFGKIPEKEIALMFKAMKETLEKGIDFGGDSMSDYRNLDGERGKFQEHHEAYRRTGLPCRKKNCGGTIERKVIRGRSGHFCGRHQKLYS